MKNHVRAITWLALAAAFILLLQANVFLYWETKTARADFIDGEFWRAQARETVPCDTDADCEAKNPHLADPHRPFYDDTDRPFNGPTDKETML